MICYTKRGKKLKNVICTLFNLCVDHSRCMANGEWWSEIILCKNNGKSHGRKSTTTQTHTILIYRDLKHFIRWTGMIKCRMNSIIWPNWYGSSGSRRWWWWCWITFSSLYSLSYMIITIIISRLILYHLFLLASMPKAKGCQNDLQQICLANMAPAFNIGSTTKMFE